MRRQKKERSYQQQTFAAPLADITYWEFWRSLPVSPFDRQVLGFFVIFSFGGLGSSLYGQKKGTGASSSQPLAII